MSDFQYDLVVIGAGSAGVRCSRVASQLGAKVAVIENRYLGGTCVNVGCIPKKLFVYASQFPEMLAAAKGYGWQMQQQSFAWDVLRDAKTNEIKRLNGVYRSILGNAGVDLYEGTAEITDAHTVAVDGKALSTSKIVIATGGWPNRNIYPGAELAVTSNEVFDLTEFPKRVVVEGGGYVAIEFAGIFNGLGCDTSLVYRGEQFLRGFDDDIRAFLAKEMREKGVRLNFKTEIAGIVKRKDGALEVTFDDGQKTVVDMVLSAIGRRVMTDGLGLENVNVHCNSRGNITVDENFQTSEPSIYALGDVVGRMPLTPVALNEGMALAKHLFAAEPITLNYDAIPTAVFSQPEIATVGLTEVGARHRYGDVEIFKSEFKPLKHTLSGLTERTLMKLIVVKDSQKVVGCHMVGEHAAEIMQGVAIAVNMGATKQDFDATVGIHPSAAEEFVTMR